MTTPKYKDNFRTNVAVQIQEKILKSYSDSARLSVIIIKKKLEDYYGLNGTKQE